MTGETSVWTGRRAFAAAVAVGLIASFAGLFDHALWTPDEPRDAEVGREMLRSGDYVVPTLAGEPFMEKPPFSWWMMAASYRLLGVSDGAARCASALAGFLALLLVFDLARRLANALAGLTSVLVAATMCGFFQHFHRAIVDPWTALFVMAGYWGFVLAAYSRRKRGQEPFSPEAPAGCCAEKAPVPFSDDQPSPWGLLVMYAAGGLAFLTKGPVGPGLLFGPVLVIIALEKRWSFFKSWAHAPGLMILAALCAWWPWALLRHEGGKDLFRTFVVENVLYRIHPPKGGAYAGGHQHFIFYYLTAFPAMVSPWFAAVPAIALWLRQRRMPAEWNGRALLALAWVFPAGLALLSVPGTKRAIYLLPLVAPASVVVGAWLAATCREEFRHRMDRVTHAIFIALPAAAAVLGVIALVVLRYSKHLQKLIGAPMHHFGPLTATLLALLIIGALGLAGYGLWLWRRGEGRAALVAPWLALLVTVVGGALTFRCLDPFFNLHNMTADLKACDAFATPLAGFRMDEVTRGLVPFDTGWRLWDLGNDPANLSDFVREQPKGKLLMLVRQMKYVPDDVKPRLKELRLWHYDKHREYALYDFSGK